MKLYLSNKSNLNSNFSRLIMNTIKAMQTLFFIFIFYFLSRVELWAFLMLFSSSILCLKKNYFMVFHLFFFKLAVFYKIKKLAIIEIIILNVIHLSFIFFYCLVIYIYCFVSIISKQYIIWLFNIFGSFRSFNIWIFKLFFYSIWNCLTNFL